MTIPANPSSYIDWDDNDVAVGDGMSKSDIEQLFSNQRFFSQRLADVESAWRRGSDVFSHFGRPSTFFGDDFSITGATVDLDNHLMDFAFGDDLRTREERRIDQVPFSYEVRVKPAAWGSSFTPIIAVTDSDTVTHGSIPGAFTNGCVIFAGTTSGTWQVVTRHNGSSPETTDNINVATFNDWVTIKITCTTAEIVVAMGTDPDALSDVATHTVDLPTNFSLYGFHAASSGGSSNKLDYLKLVTIGNPLSNG